MKQEFLKFILIGILSTIINYGSFYALLEFLSVYYLLSSGIGFFLGVIAGYFLNKDAKNSRTNYTAKENSDMVKSKIEIDNNISLKNFKVIELEAKTKDRILREINALYKKLPNDVPNKGFSVPF